MNIRFVYQKGTESAIEVHQNEMDYLACVGKDSQGRWLCSMWVHKNQSCYLHKRMFFHSREDAANLAAGFLLEII